MSNTVDGSVILHHLIGSLSHNLTGFFYIPGGAGFLPSTVLRFTSFLFL